MRYRSRTHVFIAEGYEDRLVAEGRREFAEIAAYHETAASSKTAEQVFARIAHSAAALLENPHLGRSSLAVDGIHELHVPHLPYLLPYRVIEDRIEILRVFHEAQDRPLSW